MSDIVISSGQTLSGLLIGGGTEVTVQSGGTLLDATVGISGTLDVVGGYASGTLVEYEDSNLSLGPGGIAVGTTLTAGAYAFVSSGGILSDTLVSGPGSYEGYDYSGLQIGSGGVSISSFVLSGGQENVQPGGLASLTSVGSGGFLDVAIGGSAASTVLSGGSASIPEFVSSGETVSGLEIGADQIVVVLSGGTAVDTRITAEGFLFVNSGGLASETTLAATGIPEDTQFVISAGATAVDTVIGSGMEALFDSGSTALFVTVSSGGWLDVSPGAAGSGITSSSGATVYSGNIVRSGETISGLTVSADETLVVLSGGTVLGATVEPQGYVYVSGGTVSGTVLGGLESDLFVASGGTSLATTVAGDAVETVVSGAVASDTLVSGVSSAGAYDGVSGLVVYSGGLSVDAVLSAGGTAFSYSGATAVSTTVGSGGTLSVASGGTAIETTVLSGGVLDLYSGASVSGTVNGIPCFVAGTLILTDRGLVPVEQLAVGARVLTEDGAVEPVIWVGARTIDCRRHPCPGQVQPVCIRAHAFGPDQPSRDLLLSPDHAVFAEGVLIPVRHLVNGGSVRQLDARRVAYIHIELARHSVIRAEGLAVETYLDTGDRAAFEEGAAALTLHPVFGSERRDVSLMMEACGYAPLRVTGPEVATVRARLASADAQQARAVIPQPGRGEAPVRA